jgi:saccharopine dehydrogenase-like NADP-dependent oxidoreductase
VKILVIGAGRTGRAIGRMLAGDGNFAVTLIDSTREATELARRGGLAVREADAARIEDVSKIAEGFDALICAAPNYLAPGLATVAAQRGLHYLDLGEDQDAAAKVKKVANGAKGTFLTGCGLAPGFVANLVADLVTDAQPPIDVTVRVGTLPVNTSNRLGYGLTWNVDGLIHEYSAPCEALRDGQPAVLVPLEGYEHFVLSGSQYEAFNTSGGLGDLCAYLAGKVDRLSFKTLRYRGHCDLMKFLLDDMGLGRRKDLLRAVLSNGIPEIDQDKVIVYVTVLGQRGHSRHETTHIQTILGAEEQQGERVSAMQSASAAHVCAMADLIRQGVIGGGGAQAVGGVTLAQLAKSPFAETLLAGTLANAPTSC